MPEPVHGEKKTFEVYTPHIKYTLCCFPVQLSLGAVQGHGLQKPILSNRNFHGCLENLLFNDLNLIDLAKQNSPQVTVMVSYCVSATLKDNLAFKVILLHMAQNSTSSHA